MYYWHLNMALHVHTPALFYTARGLMGGFLQVAVYFCAGVLLLLEKKYTNTKEDNQSIKNTIVYGPLKYGKWVTWNTFNALQKYSLFHLLIIFPNTTQSIKNTNQPCQNMCISSSTFTPGLSVW